MTDYDKSNRSVTLANALEPFMRRGDTVLDIGCGFPSHPALQGTLLPRWLYERYGIAYHGIDNRAEVVTAGRLAWPWATFTLGDAATMSLCRYDVVMHLGFDRKDLSDAWKIHGRLIEAGLAPRIVLLEAGSPLGKKSKHLECWADVQTIYEAAGYVVAAMGSYEWTAKVTQPARRYVVMEKR